MPDALASLLYTSGSTGEPKGVSQTHQSILHEIMNYTNGLHITPNDRLALLRPVTLSAALRNFYGAVLNGACLYPFNIKARGMDRVADWLAEEEITIIRASATMFRQMVSNLDAEDEFPHLRLVYLGAEPLSNTDVKLYQKHCSDDCVLINGLGSTETTTFRWYFFGKETRITTGTVTVGYPVAGMEVLLLDENGQEVPPSPTDEIMGEIAVKSRYLFPGYWRKPELTQAAFLADREGDSARIYRTGDLGRMQPDGCLEHLGCKDSKVMVGGFSVELAEVEMALLDQKTVRQATVMMREDSPGDQRLVAYIVPRPGSNPTVSALLAALLRKLPQHMLPQSFVLLDSLPQLPNGKLDLKKLPPPDPGRPNLETPFVAPEGPVQEVLSHIWTQVLHLEQVGIRDSFLELGGSSLLAGQVISRVNKKFSVELPLKSLFASPTIAEMALEIVEIQLTQSNQQEIDQMLAELA